MEPTIKTQFMLTIIITLVSTILLAHGGSLWVSFPPVLVMLKDGTKLSPCAEEGDSPTGSGLLICACGMC